MALRALAVLLLVGLSLLPETGPFQQAWLRTRFSAGTAPSWERVVWVTGSRLETPEPEWAARLEVHSPELLVWCEAPLPPPGSRRILWKNEVPPGGGRLLRSLGQWQGSLTETVLRELGRNLPSGGFLFREPILDYSRGPGELSIDLVEANPGTLAGRILVVGSAENLNGPPTPLGPMPVSRAVAQGLSATLEGNLLWPLHSLWVFFLALIMARWAWTRSPEKEVLALVLPAFLGLVLVPLTCWILFRILGWLVPPLPLLAGFLGGGLAAPRDQEEAQSKALERGLSELLEKPDLGIEIVLLGLPESVRESRRRLYEFLRDPTGAAPQPLSEFEYFELMALHEALRSRGDPPERRLEVLEWACLRAPENQEVQAGFQSCLEEISVEMSLIDLDSIKAAVDPRYQDLKLVGQGAMGLVLLGEDQALERPVAIKVVNPSVLEDEDTTGRFWREIEALSVFTHPHIVQIYAVHPGRIPYYVMEFLPGETLKSALEKGSLGPKERLLALEQFAAALDHIHSRGIIHRDLKPENLVLADSGEELEPARLVMIDFGVAKGSRSRPLTQAGDVLGTLSYMAPEQLAGGGVDSSADRFAFGAIAFEVLSGKRPFKNPYQAQKQTCPELVPLEITVSPETVAEIRSLLQGDPKLRPEDLGYMRDLLKRDLFSNKPPVPDSLIHEEGIDRPQSVP